MLTRARVRCCVRTVHVMFLSIVCYLYRDLSNNNFDWLPHKDLRLSIQQISVTGVPQLVQFPPAYTNGKQTFQRLKILNLTYAVHCCWYEHYVVHDVFVPDFTEVNETALPENCTVENFFDCFGMNLTGSEIPLSSCPNTPTNFTKIDVKFICSPPKDPFHPCYDIIDYLWLRIGIWFVIVISLCGNVLVFTVFLYGAMKKSLTVPQLMIMNLAAADFCLGLYLLFIAAADLDTAGNYFNEWYDWERGSACKTAGFFAVLSSIASICILGLITFERMITIVFTFSGRKIMTRPRTSICLVIIWSIAVLFAILPIFEISSYTRVAICLPIDERSTKDKVYVAFILFLTGVVCFLICICYIILFVRVKKTTTSLTAREEFKLALKIAVLVVTDFLVWIPIAVISLAGLFTGDTIIGLQASKYLLILVFPINSLINPVLYSVMQNAFRNQICEVMANLGLFKDYHNQKKLRQRGPSIIASHNPSGSNRSQRVLLSPTTSSSLTLVSLDGSQQDSSCELIRYTRSPLRSCRSTSSEPNGFIDGMYGLNHSYV